MAATINDKDTFLLAEITRVLTVVLPSTVSTSGNHVGTIDGTAPSGVKNTSVTLSSSGTLNGAGGGSISALDYGNVAGTKPPANATQNIFSTSTIDPTGGVDGDAHWNSTTSVMWFKTAGTWKAGGTVSASAITTGTLGAARIATNSLTADKIVSGSITSTQIAAGTITTDKLNVTTLSAITSNLGTVTAGSITGSAGINITGQSVFNGNTSISGQYAGTHINNLLGSINGGIAYSNSGIAFQGLGSGTNGDGLYGTASGSGGVGVAAVHTGGGKALSVNGTMSISNTTLVTNLNADLLDGNHASAFLTTSGTAADSSKLGGITSSSWARTFPTNSGTANASGAGLNIMVTGTLGSTVRTRGTTNFCYIENISDERLKTDIQDESLGLAFIMKMRPRQFRMKADPMLIAHGFIAQEVKLLLADTDGLSSENGDGTKSFDYNGITAPLVKAVQELSKKLDAATARIEYLESTAVL